MASGRFGLTFERPQLASYLAEQILQAEEVAFRRRQSTLGLLLRLRYLKDAGRFFDVH